MKTKKSIKLTTSKVTEALFNILSDKIYDSIFLDLYAGTGAIGKEAMNRGAQKVVFVDINSRSIESISKMMENNFKDNFRAIKGRAYNVLQRLIKEGTTFNIIFIDPPYISEEIDRVLPLIGKGNIIKNNATVIVEHLYKKVLPEKTGCLCFRRSYRYGDTILSLFEKI